jgi:hypothetical protein
MLMHIGENLLLEISEYIKTKGWQVRPSCWVNGHWKLGIESGDRLFFITIDSPSPSFPPVARWTTSSSPF